MKKNISINISGIIFHIEEDGYDQLRSYLESINRYFSSFDDSLEIIADIESRIAEIFLSELKDGKQVISKEDVEKLMATMGSIEDFQAAEEESSYIFEARHEEKSKSKEQTSQEHAEEFAFSRRLYRDEKRKILGGVLAGIAYYFNIDALWIRLLYLLLFFGISALPSIGGILFVTYIVLWIVIPGSMDLQEKRKIKKMYRDPDNKVLGGVGGGIAAYFGIDVIIVRLLFFLSIFLGGTGLILYIILWIILPEARTITDKLEMKGKPLTLSNIEESIRKGLNIKEDDENILGKIVLFPFRLVSSVIEFLSKSSGPFFKFLGQLLKVVAGLLLLLTGVSLLISLFVAFGVITGVITNYSWLAIDNIPVHVIGQDIGVLTGAALFIFFFIPFILLAIAGAAVLMKKHFVNPAATWSLLGIWFISIIALSFIIPSKIHAFNTEGQYKKETSWDIKDKVLVLKYKELPGINAIDLKHVNLNLRSHYDSSVRLVQYYSARGNNRNEAIENAQHIDYNVVQQDSILTFNSDFNLKGNAPFRVQKVELVLYLPLGQKFVMDEQLQRLLGGFMYKNGYSDYDIEGNIWEFNSNGLNCVTCPEEDQPYTSDEEDSYDSPASGSGFDKSEIRGYLKILDNFDSFSQLNLEGNIEVFVQKSDKPEVILNGDEGLVKDVEVEEKSGVLYVAMNEDVERDAIKLYISMPELSKMKINAGSTAFVEGFSGDKMDIDLRNGASAEVNVDTKFVGIKLEDASKLVLEGDGNVMKANVSGASRLMAFEFEARKINLVISKNATARLNAQDEIKINATEQSHVRYKGDAVVEIEKSENSKVTKN